MPPDQLAASAIVIATSTLARGSTLRLEAVTGLLHTEMRF